MKLNENDVQRETQLLDICKTNQGEFLLAGSGSGSWATTYSNEFIAAAADLYSLYKENGSSYPQFLLSQRFRDAGIRSCRGAAMNIDKVEYLLKAHVLRKIRTR
jgi:hypothetical protein